VSRRSPSWCTKKPLARRRSRFGARVKGRASAPEDAFPSSKKADRTLTRNNGIEEGVRVRYQTGVRTQTSFS
jgi:hypothetical protein